jgi:hypothetical protein
MTQNEALLAYLKKHHFITRVQAASKPLLIMNLWSRIAELEEQGHRFDRRPYTTRTGKHVLQYWLRQGRQAKRAA